MKASLIQTKSNVRPGLVILIQTRPNVKPGLVRPNQSKGNVSYYDTKDRLGQSNPKLRPSLYIKNWTKLRPGLNFYLL